MKLLIITQAVDQDDSNLGFFCRWVTKFAAHCEHVLVICLREGTHALPQNVEVLSLGKEKGASRLMRVIRFYRYVVSRRSEYDAVFVHMNPEYIVLAGRLWRRWHKSVALWYAHKSVTRRLRRALNYVSYVFTVSPTSFRIPTPKLRVVGHGIDTELFKPGMHEESAYLRVMTAGRIAESKRLVEMLQVLDVLAERGVRFTFTVVGEALTPAEERYADVLKQEIAKRPYRDAVTLLGAVPYIRLPELLNAQDIVLNFGMTGNMDKAGLEALAAGVPLLTTNEAFEPLLSPYGLYVKSRMPADIAQALDEFMNRPDKAAVMATLRNKVIAEHSLQALIPKILTQLNSGMQSSYDTV